MMDICDNDCPFEHIFDLVSWMQLTQFLPESETHADKMGKH